MFGAYVHKAFSDDIYVLYVHPVFLSSPIFDYFFVHFVIRTNLTQNLNLKNDIYCFPYSWMPHFSYNESFTIYPSTDRS